MLAFCSGNVAMGVLVCGEKDPFYSVKYYPIVSPPTKTRRVAVAVLCLYSKTKFSDGSTVFHWLDFLPLKNLISDRGM